MWLGENTLRVNRLGTSSGVASPIVEHSHSREAVSTRERDGLDRGMTGVGGRDSMEEPGSLSLFGAVSLGTGVMIGAGIFALTGQVAALSGDLFPVAFLVAAVVVAFSAYSYVKLSNAFPSSGGIAMFLKEAYGLGATTGVFALLMYVSMVISESFVARTFGAYILRIVDLSPISFWVPSLGVALLVVAFGVNIAGNRAVEASQGAMAIVKVGGLALFAIAGLWFITASNFTNGSQGTETFNSGGFMAGVALAILAYKGFTTIANSGGEIVDPHRNTGRAIVISIAVSAILYLTLAVMVAGNLSLAEIIKAQNFVLAEAAGPAFGDSGVWLTVALAVVATASGVMASVFAASRMLAMLTSMREVPHRHFRLPGTLRTHAMVYTVAFAIVLTLLFDLQRIAALGAIFYLIMDVAIQWGVLKHLRSRIDVAPAIVVTAIVLDVVVLVAFLWVKASEDLLVPFVSILGVGLIVIGERIFMRSHTRVDGTMEM